MRILVTGSHGFIGQHLVSALKDRRYDVFCFDLKNGRFGGDDLNSKVSVENALAAHKPDIVYHLAAIKSVPFSFLYPTKVMETNTIGTLKLLGMCEKYGVRQFIYASSSSVYGGCEVSSNETDIPNPLSPYAISKLNGEYFSKLYKNKMHVVITRFFNVYGPGQQTDSAYAAVIPKWIKAAIEGKPAIIYGDGKQKRDFTYVGDVVAGLCRLLRSDHDLPSGIILNIANGHSVSLLDLKAEITRLSNTPVNFVHEPAKEGDVYKSCANVKLAIQSINFEAKIPLKKGLEWMFRCMRGELR